MLSGGDILKRDDIIWGFTFEDVKPYMDYKSRDYLFREAVLSFLGVKTQKQTEDTYCEVCRAAGKDIDCANCSKEIVEEKQERKSIG